MYYSWPLRNLNEKKKLYNFTSANVLLLVYYNNTKYYN